MYIGSILVSGVLLFFTKLSCYEFFCLKSCCLSNFTVIFHVIQWSGKIVLSKGKIRENENLKSMLALSSLIRISMLRVKNQSLRSISPSASETVVMLFKQSCVIPLAKNHAVKITEI